MDKKYILEAQDAALLIIDIQDKLAAAMQERDRVVKNCLHLIELAKMIDMPVLVTEQYPKGLGRTVAEIQSALPEYHPIEKTAFNCCGDAVFMDAIRKLNRKKVIIAGMETHICVLQTAAGLLQEGFQPHVVRDAVCSRTDENRQAGIEYMRDAGAVITGAETVLFQILKTAGTEEFKKISQRIK